MKVIWEERLKDTKCPLCGAKLKYIQGKYNEFIGCSRFPYCRFSLSKNKFEEWLKANQKPLFLKGFYIEEKYKIKLPEKLVELFCEAEKELETEEGGFVYFIRILNKPNLIKIGKTRSLINRLLTLDGEREGIIPVYILKTRFYSAMEVFFHELFKKFLAEGNEYFTIPPEYLIEITKIKIFLNEPVERIDKFNPALIEALKAKRKYRIEESIVEEIEKKEREKRKMWKEYYKEKEKLEIKKII